MNTNVARPVMSLIDIEAYAMPSSSYVQNDSHCFVVTLDRNTEWCNKGGGWRDSRPKTKVVSNRAYKELIMDFIPPNDIDKCGIEFYVNGVCHTYANREMLMGESNVSVQDASKDYVCVFFFGKYGIGLKRLKRLLQESYNRVIVNYSDPYFALSKLLIRVDNYLDDEVNAWMLTLEEYAKIPVKALLAKSPSCGMATMRSRLQKLINEREEAYERYLAGTLSDFKGELRRIIQANSDDYLNMLCQINFITVSQKTTYSRNIAEFINAFSCALQAQENNLLKNGVLDLDFLNNINSSMEG